MATVSALFHLIFGERVSYLEIHHTFICTKKKAPAGDLLVDFSLIEGSSNIQLCHLFTGFKHRYEESTDTVQRLRRYGDIK